VGFSIVLFSRALLESGKQENPPLCCEYAAQRGGAWENSTDSLVTKSIDKGKPTRTAVCHIQNVNMQRDTRNRTLS